ncbi:MAG: hypothetical protein H7234_04155 [Herminiimonas sp.]|nr:hypothetical protein [Herminiimonas sp.]
MSFRSSLFKNKLATLNDVPETFSPGTPAQAAIKRADSARKTVKGRLQGLSILRRSPKAAAIKSGSFAPPLPELERLKPAFFPARPAGTVARADSFKAVTTQKHVPSAGIADVSFNGQATQISKHNAQRFMQLRLTILQQPAGQPTHNDKAMQAILASQDIGERDRLLLQNVQFAENRSAVTFNGVTADISSNTRLPMMQLRNNLLKLSPESASPYNALLADVLASKDIDRRHRLISAMGKQVEQHLQKFATVEFNGTPAEIARPRQLEFMQLRLDLMKLPHARGQEYTRLVQDVLTNRPAGAREKLLGDIARQVAQETKGSN